MADKNVNMSLNLDADDAIMKTAKLRQALKDEQAILSQIEKQYGTKSDQAVASAIKVEQANNAVNESLKKTNEHISSLESFKNVLSGIQGGFGAITGTLSLFGEKSEAVEKALGKVKAAIEITEGIASIQKGIAAFKDFGTAVSQVAAKGFGALKTAIAETGIGLLVIGLGILFAKLTEAKEETDETANSLKELNDALKAADSEYIKSATQVSTLQEHIKLAKEGFIDKKRVVEEYNTTIGKVTGQVKNLNEVEAKLSNPDLVKAYKDAMFEKALATIALQKAAEGAFKAQNAQLEITKLTGEKDKLEAQGPVKKIVGSGRGQATIDLNASRLKELADQIGTQKKLLEEGTKLQENGQKIADENYALLSDKAKKYHFNILEAV